MFDGITAAKASVTGLMAFLLAEFGMIAPAFALLGAVMALDYVTGVLRSAVLRHKSPADPAAGLSSRRGVIGIYKKIGYMIGVAAGLSFDGLLRVACGYAGVGPRLPATFFGLMVCCWFILTEMISIFENLCEAGVRMPPFMKNLAELLQHRVEVSGERAAGEIAENMGKEDKRIM